MEYYNYDNNVKKLNLFQIILLILADVTFFVVFIYSLYHIFFVFYHSKITLGQITHINYGRSIKKPLTNVDYSFVVNDKQYKDDQLIIYYNNYFIGKEIEIKYNKDNPNISIIKSNIWQTIIIMFMDLCLAIFLLVKVILKQFSKTASNSR